MNMNEYGIFQSIIEGEQAEDYKDNKQYRKEKEEDADRKRKESRYGSTKHQVGNKANQYANPHATDDMKKYRDSVKKDSERQVKAGKKVDRQLRNSDSDKANRLHKDLDTALDATNRHLRRHPESESTIEFV